MKRKRLTATLAAILSAMYFSAAASAQEPATQTELQDGSPASITLTLTAKSKQTDEALTGVTFTIQKQDGSEEQNLDADDKGQAELTGYLEPGETYLVSQSRKPGFYEAVSDDLTNGQYTIPANADKLSVTFTSQPTIVHLSVIDGISETSPYRGSYVAGAALEIAQVTGSGGQTVLKTIDTVLTKKGISTLTGVLDPGSKYRITQISAPAGYVVSTVAKQFEMSTLEEERSIQLSDDTVKVLISRKGYDDRKEKNINGKNTYEYENLRPLSGAALEIRDGNGKTLTDRNGVPLQWISDDSGYHKIEGVLSTGTSYILAETAAPSGYEKAEPGTFTTYRSGNEALISMQTARTAETPAASPSGPSSETGSFPKEPSSNALKFLTALKTMSERVKSDREQGKLWVYGEYSSSQTWEDELKNAALGRGGNCTCLQMVKWGLQMAGILTEKQDISCINDGIFSHNTALEDSEFYEKFEVLHVNKTNRELIEEGILLPGDICGYEDHENVYAGNESWFDAGRTAACNYKNGRYVFRSFGPFSDWIDQTVIEILRVK